MSAELLREAAKTMRDDFSSADLPGDPRWLAVADWLDHMAARAELKAQRGGNRVAVWAHEHHAIAVASAYLGRDQ